MTRGKQQVLSCSFFVFFSSHGPRSLVCSTVWIELVAIFCFCTAVDTITFLILLTPQPIIQSFDIHSFDYNCHWPLKNYHGQVFQSQNHLKVLVSPDISKVEKFAVYQLFFYLYVQGQSRWEVSTNTTRIKCEREWIDCY